MAEEKKDPQNETQMPQAHHKMLDQTLGSLLQGNQAARDHIIKAMRITTQQFEEMLQMTENNQLMQITIGELFKNGIVQKAVGEKNMPLTSEQIAALENNEPVMQKKEYKKETENKTFLEKIKGWF